MKESDLPSVIEDNRIHFDAFTARDLLRRSTGDIYAPKMATIYIVLVRRKDDETFVRRQRCAVDFEFARRQ